MNNIPVNHQGIDDIDTDVNEFTLAEEAGLIHTGFDEDGSPQWLGNKKQWGKYYQLLTENDL